jgi:lipoprotein NlpD
VPGVKTVKLPMATTTRYPGFVALLVLLVACSTGPINAPVVSRDPLAGTPPASAAGSAGAAGNPGSYTVRRGDTLYSVAWQNGLNFRQLADMNGIHPPYTIYVGQSLRIAPTPPDAPASIPPPATAARQQSVPAVSAGGTSTAGGAQPHPPASSAPAKAPAHATPAEPVPQAEPALPAVVSHWVWPVKGPLLRSYTPNGNGKKGIDIGGQAGQPVRAAADGKVVYSGSGLVGYGRLIIIKHNDNLLSAYGHNSALLVAEGDYVKAGQVIAKMGSSGTSSTRLYFEIRQDGRPVNPLSYLPHS